MPRAALNDIELYYEVTGDEGAFPIVFVHEFAGDHRSWEPQVRFFARQYRCIAYSQRGYPPSSVPENPASYSQDHLIEDLRGLLGHLGIEQAHVVGFSMGASVALNLALGHPELCRSIVVAGCGSGTTERERFEHDVKDVVELLLTSGIERFAEVYTLAPSRLPFKRKDPKGWAELRDQLSQHSALGSALTMQGVQLRRPTIFSLKEKLNALRVPTLVMVGDEDEPCVDPSVFMKREIPSAGLEFFPQSGHAINLEEPARFNQSVQAFLALVEAGRWATREQVSTSLMPR